MEVVRPKKKAKAKKKTKREKELEPEDIEGRRKEEERTGTNEEEGPSQPTITVTPEENIPSVPPVTTTHETTPTNITEETQSVIPESTTPILIANETSPPESINEFRSPVPTESLQNVRPDLDLMSFDDHPQTTEVVTSVHVQSSQEVSHDQELLSHDQELSSHDELRTQVLLHETQDENQSTKNVKSEQKVTELVTTNLVTMETTNHGKEVTVQPSAPVVIETEVLYPRLDSLVAATLRSEVNQKLIPYTEDDLALMYLNPQLAANQEFVENFIRESEQSHHPLYELLNQYLKARLSFRTAEAKVEGLKKEYSENQSQIWSVERKTISSTGRCRDNSKVTHTHSHKFAQLDSIAVDRTGNNLSELRDVLQEELSMKSYSSQLARIHVEYYLHQLLQSVPFLSSLPQDAPITGYIPECPPGSLDHCTLELRHCVSVLFMFERKPHRDKQFSIDCRHWLDLMINALLRVASLSDHLFILNHLLRSPPSVGRWSVKFLHPLSPLKHEGSLRPTLSGDQSDVTDVEYSLNWNTTLRDSNWGGPILDNWVAMLQTLLQPVIGRDDFLRNLVLPSSSDGLSRQESQPWTFVEEDLDEDIDEERSLNLKESDFISFLDQFSFTEIFKYILQVNDEDSYSSSQTTSYQMMQLIAFCTCIIRILGMSFSSLRQSKYREFIKQVGRTVRQVVHYVADHWLCYKVYKEQLGDTSSAVPTGESGLSRYSLDRLQIEFDQFVLRATQWILTAHKLGAWQFMADMPYSSIALMTLWKILWTLYHYQITNRQSVLPGEVDREEDFVLERRGSVLSDRVDLDSIPKTWEEILTDIRDASCHAQFIDVLMKTYTSEAVFLLTTFVNMARSRTADNDEEIMFINTITEEIFQFTQVEEYARDAYSRTGCSLIGTIASVHPFIITVILNKVYHVVQDIGENCILLFKELPLHLWIPTQEDISVVRSWLISSSLSSHEQVLAKVIISGLNWGVKSDESKESSSLVLPFSLHREIALSLVEASSRHLSSQPGGFDYNPVGSTISKYASSIRSMLSSDQVEFTSWLWEAVLMLKLHPSQLSLLSILPSSHVTAKEPESTNEIAGAKNPEVYKQSSSSHSGEMIFETELPELTDSRINGFDQLRDSVQRDGLLAFYVSLCMSNIGSDATQFVLRGLPMTQKLIEQGYYLPVLRIIGNVTSMMFKQRKVLLNEPSFIQLLHSVANADSNTASLKDRLTWSTPSPLIVRRFSALITTQLHRCAKSQSDVELILVFWLEALFSIPVWIRESCILYLLNGICIAIFGNEHLEKVILEHLLDQYQLLQPLQQKSRKLLSAVTSSVLSMVGQDGGPPSIYNVIPHGEYPWLSYYTLKAEQEFEEKEGIWKTFLKHIKKDPKISVDNALKKTLSDLQHNGSSFNINHLCIYRWAEFASTVDHNFILTPLVWQRFFALYLQRPFLDHSMPERGSLGLRLFTANWTQTVRREMKTALSNTCKDTQKEMESLNNDIREGEETKEHILVLNFLPRYLRFYQTLKLWIQEPRLHEETLFLPGLPQQYDPDRLALVFLTKQEDWVEFLRVWEVGETIRVMIHEWAQIASYQKPLPSQTESHDASPDTAASRIQKRLSRHTSPVPPSSFYLPSPPFPLLPSEVLLSKDALLPSVIKDINFIAQQAKIYSDRMNTLGALDAEYMSGIPDLYSNQRRQFHVSVPCHSKFNRSHVCLGPATIVFRFDEMTPHPHWEERIKQNRDEHAELLGALCVPIPHEMCKAVARTEHAVSELSKLTMNQNAEALSSGVALFYEILKFINNDVKQFPPSCQFFTSCVEIIGQEFIQHDPLQTANILQIILSQRSVGKLLAPLFNPNSCSSQFLSMYGSVGEVAVKEGPEIAFSVLTKFNLAQWFDEASPSVMDCRTLLDYVFHGIKFCGQNSSFEGKALLGAYMLHMKELVDYQFPLLYNEALHHLIEGTETAEILPQCWNELINVVMTSDSPNSDSCRLGIQQVSESGQYLAEHFTQKRFYTQESLFEVISVDFIIKIAHFMSMLATALLTKSLASVELENISSNQALEEYWDWIINLFSPWIFPIQYSESSPVLFPCNIEETVLLSDSVEIFADLLSKMETSFAAHGESMFPLLWPFYCNHLSTSTVPDHVLQCYHAHFTHLPWQRYIPNLQAMNLMIELKVKPHPLACLVFLGDIFPLMNWRSITARYSSQPNTDITVKFYIMLLQLLVMLAAEPDVMRKKESKVPALLSEAKSYQLHYIDYKTFDDILSWQKNNCQCIAVLQTGSPLSTSLRLLKAAASFPTSLDSNVLQLHQNGWEKRHSFMRLVVELVAGATQQKETHTLSYADILSFMIQCVVDIAVYEPESRFSRDVILLLQEFLNLFNICNPSPPLVDSLLSHLSYCLLEIPNAQLVCLSTITAASHTLVSVPLMGQVTEDAIMSYFKSLPSPNAQTLRLPFQKEMYGWRDVTNAIAVPETADVEFTQHCVNTCACLGLHACLMQKFPRCKNIAQEYDIVCEVVQWCTKLKPKVDKEAHVFLIWEKAISLLLRQIQYGGSVTKVVPQFATLATTLQRYGEDKATEGLLGAIGLGRKSSYSLQFRFIARVISVFIHCQMPMDSTHATIIRVSPNAPGHVKDPLRNQLGSLVCATKQADQGCAGLEGLVSNKNYTSLKEYVIYSLEFVNDVKYSLFDTLQLLVYLVTNLYSDERCLDSLRVIQA